MEPTTLEGSLQSERGIAEDRAMSVVRVQGTPCSFGDAEAPLVFLDLDPVRMPAGVLHTHAIDKVVAAGDGMDAERDEIAKKACELLRPYPKAIVLLHSWGTLDSTWDWGVLPNIKRVAGVAMLGGGGLLNHPHVVLREFTIPTVLGLADSTQQLEALRQLGEVVVKGGRQGLPARVHVSRRSAWLEVEADGATVSRHHHQV